MILLKTGRLEAEMANRNWRNEDLAARSGLSYPMICKLRSGDRYPGHETISGLLLALPELSFEDLFVVATGPDGGNVQGTAGRMDRELRSLPCGPSDGRGTANDEGRADGSGTGGGHGTDGGSSTDDDDADAVSAPAVGYPPARQSGAGSDPGGGDSAPAASDDDAASPPSGQGTGVAQLVTASDGDRSGDIPGPQGPGGHQESETT